MYHLCTQQQTLTLRLSLKKPTTSGESTLNITEASDF